MNNTKTPEQIFLSRTENCPFCDAELKEVTTSKSLVDKKECTIYDYGCQLQLRLDKEIINNEEVTKLTSTQCCHSRTIALQTVLELQYQLNQKQ